MGVWRKWIFPILRIVAILAIAAALVKLAFFADPASADGPAVPTGTITDPVVPVVRGTIVNDVSVDGTISADPAVPVKAVAAGTVDELFVAQGATVSAGDALFDIKVETPRDPVETTGPDGMVTITQPKPIVTYEKVLAPIGGLLSSLTVLHGQTVAIGDVAGQVAPPTFSVSGSLAPEQQYRLLDKPTEATATIAGGPAPFTCTGLTITSPIAGQTADPDNPGDGSTGSGTTVRCAVPGDVTVFPGLTAKLTIPAGLAEDVLVVPTTAVDGGAQTGVVFVVGADNAREERQITVGLSDGSQVEVTGGLEEGEQILQFSPNSTEQPLEEGCVDDGTGTVICGGFVR
ncbi:efflux RND transporter periplasmic adaptor subunit [Amnibacterium flavum]|uniref:efflux RND transporter periplasmic adaptor subunit n=1 Tax=Amnibacterium flavum TaxID=2173173 RepID=UPI00196A640B|nr:efflux RND transporter periplasmic adaptor subunit [Amnibacterium flavum]